MIATNPPHPAVAVAALGALGILLLLTTSRHVWQLHRAASEPRKAGSGKQDDDDDDDDGSRSNGEDEDNGPYVYLDYLATTPICPEVTAKMTQMLNCGCLNPRGGWGNPGSLHHPFGELAAEQLQVAREQVARLINATPGEICFESGSTESINHAIKGVLASARAADPKRSHIVLSSVEHPAVLETVLALCSSSSPLATTAGGGGGARYTMVPVDPFGLVSADRVADAVIPGETAVVTIMMAQNEIGSVMPIGEIVRAVKRVDSRVLVHVDASQAVGKIPIDVRDLGVDLLTLAGHKMYAPKGIGALFISQSVASSVKSLVHGAGHESGRRAGTENVLLATALGVGAETAQRTCLVSADRTRALRDRLYSAIVQGLYRDWGGDVQVVRNGPPGENARLPGALSLSFVGTRVVSGARIAADAGQLGVAFSAGAACHSGHKEVPSRVLKATGMGDRQALSTIRLSVGRFTTEREVDRAASCVVNVVAGVLGKPHRGTSTTT